mmetsp:Transcript_16640/g.38510  ORF Transcript_16640/g.38510 Transcript_16640/m.38510 type:complete len:303 (+) Transcript_16640:880-1788(+)
MVRAAEVAARLVSFLDEASVRRVSQWGLTPLSALPYAPSIVPLRCEAMPAARSGLAAASSLCLSARASWCEASSSSCKCATSEANAPTASSAVLVATVRFASVFSRDLTREYFSRNSRLSFWLSVLNLPTFSRASLFASSHFFSFSAILALSFFISSSFDSRSSRVVARADSVSFRFARVLLSSLANSFACFSSSTTWSPSSAVKDVRAATSDLDSLADFLILARSASSRPFSPVAFSKLLPAKASSSRSFSARASRSAPSSWVILSSTPRAVSSSSLMVSSSSVSCMASSASFKCLEASST